MSPPRILIVLPLRAPYTYPYDYSIRMMGMRAMLTPVGICTVAALLPDHWELRLVDMNAKKLADDDIRWADYVFLSATIGQETSLLETARRVKGFGKHIFVGGSLMNSSAFRFEGEKDLDSLCIGELEGYREELIADVEARTPKRKYFAHQRPEFSAIPHRPPRYDMLGKLQQMTYASAAIEMSRGCPFDCEFCDIINVFGRHPRYKTPAQVIAELDSLRALGWGGIVTIIDDNFIGRRNSARATLEAIIEWQKKNGYPFIFGTVTTINIADEDDMMRLFLEAGIRQIFIGIETPNEDSLREIHKLINLKGSIKDKIVKLRRAGFDILGGMIAGFDADTPKTFDTVMEFVDETKLPFPYFQILQAIDNTAMFDRLKAEGRLIDALGHGRRIDTTGKSRALAHETGRTNFIPKMGAVALQTNYARTLEYLFGPTFFDRLADHTLELPESYPKEVVNMFAPAVNTMNVFCLLFNLIFGLDRLRIFSQSWRVLRAGGWWRFWKFHQIAQMGCGFAFHYRRFRRLVAEYPISEAELAQLQTVKPEAAIPKAGTPLRIVA